MSIQTDINTLRENLADETDPAAFLDAVLIATGVTIPDAQKQVVLLTHTREQILKKFVAQAI